MNLPLMGIGIAVWGLVSNQKKPDPLCTQPKTGVMFPLGKKMAGEIQTSRSSPKNDANASALGEYYFGVGKGSENYIYLSIDVGVGSGIISKGHLFQGCRWFLPGRSDISPLIRTEIFCSCGKRGCLETKVGRDVIMRKYKEFIQRW